MRPAENPTIPTNFYWRGHLWHVRGYDDNDKYVIMRRWSRKKRTWIYEVELTEVITIVLNWIPANEG